MYLALALVLALLCVAGGASAVSARTEHTSDPFAPRDLAVIADSTDELKIRWRKPKQAARVARYAVSANAAYVGSTTYLQYLIRGLACGTRYVVGVRSVDAAGNRSQRGDARPPHRSRA